MIEKPNNLPDDEFFKEAASKYIDKLGNDLLSDALSTDSSSLSSAHIRRVHEKIKVRQRKSLIQKITAISLSTAACIAFVIIYFFMPSRNLPNSNATSISIDPIVASETAAAEFLSARLPLGYYLTKTDLDNGQMVCYIESGNNEIILVMEEWKDSVPARPLTQINVNGASMYAIYMNDYSLLTYKKSDLRFTLTSQYDYRDLITIGAALT